MKIQDKLAPLLAAADDVPYFPADAYEERRRRFVHRGLLLVLLALAAHPLPFIVVLAKICHWKELKFPWIWLDRYQIQENILLHSVRGFLQFWLHPLVTGRSPLGGTILYLQYLAFGALSTNGYHVITLLAHAGNCLLVWVILRRLDVRGAWLAAAIFAVHPIEVQSVTWAARQADVLGTSAGLASLLAFLKLKEIHPPAPADFAVSPGSPLRPRIAMTALFTIAILFWPSIAPLAAVFPLILWWKRGRPDRPDWIELFPILGLATVVMLLGLFLSEYHHEGGPAAALGILDRLIFGGRALWFYAESMIAPWPSSFLYQRWELHGDLWMLVFPLATTAVIFWLWRQRQTLGAAPLTAVAAFLILALPHLPLIRSDWMGFSFVADHLQYLAGIPLIALMTALVIWLVDKVPEMDLRRAARLGVAGALIGGLAAIAIINTLSYTSEERIWNDAKYNQPMGLTARAMLSQFYFENAELLKADQFPSSVQSRIERLKAFGGADAGGTILTQLAQAAVLSAHRQFSSAIDIYRDVLKIDPGNREATKRLGVAYRDRGDLRDALECFREAAEKYPTDDLLNEYGSALIQSGRIDEGIEKLRASVRLNPNFIAARINLSNALFSQHNYTDAADQLKIVNKLDPLNFDAFMAGGVDVAILGDLPKAELFLKAAVQSRPSSPEAHFALGEVQERQKEYGEAVDSYATAVKLKPDFKEAIEALDRARAELAGNR